MEGDGEAELYAVQQECSHSVTSAICRWAAAVIIVDIGWVWEVLLTEIGNV